MEPVKHEGIFSTQRTTPENDLVGNLVLGSSRVIAANSALIAPESGNAMSGPFQPFCYRTVLPGRFLLLKEP